MLNKVKELLSSKKMTAYGLAKVTGLPQKTIYRLYNDPEHIPNGKILGKLGEVFPDTTPNDWLTFIRE